MMDEATIRTSGSALHVRLDGPEDAPVLVLSNSLGTSYEMWDPQVPALAACFRVLRYDQRGHGRSAVPEQPFTVADLGRDVVALLDAVGCERASFAGVSLGGMIGMWLGANEPTRVDRLVLACTAPYMGPPEPWQERAASVRRHGTKALVDALLGRWFTAPYLADHPEVAEHFTTMLGDAADDGYARCCEAIAAMDQRGSLSRITAPTLVLAGVEDPAATPRAALEMHESIPGSSLVVLDRAAHLANVERAEAFTQAMLAHLAGTTFERGMDERRRVLGTDYVEQAAARAAQSGSPAFVAFQRMITEGAWGTVWSRPALDRRARRQLTLALLAGLGRLEEFEVHARAAMADTSGGLDAEGIGEVLLHTSVYAGVPAANAAFSILTSLAAPPGD